MGEEPLLEPQYLAYETDVRENPPEVPVSMHIAMVAASRVEMARTLGRVIERLLHPDAPLYMNQSFRLDRGIVSHSYSDDPKNPVVVVLDGRSRKQLSKVVGIA